MAGRLGLTSYAYYWATQRAGATGTPPMTAWSLLDTTAQLGLKVLQICEHVPFAEWDGAQLDAFRLAAEQRGVQIEVGTRGLDAETLMRAESTAKRVGSSLLRVVPWSGEPIRRELTLDVLHGALEELLPICRAHGITVALENYFDLPDERLVEYMERHGASNLGVCLDTANSTGLLQQPLDTVRRLAPYAVSVHLKDFTVTKSMSGYRIAGAPLGQGWLDVAGVLDALRRAGRQPDLLIENWIEPSDSPTDVYAVEAEWVRESVAYARDHLKSGQATA